MELERKYKQMKSVAKSEFRTYFADVSVYVKMSAILKELKIHKSTFSKFMQSSAYDHYLSESKLQMIKYALQERLKNFT